MQPFQAIFIAFLLTFIVVKHACGQSCLGCIKSKTSCTAGGSSCPTDKITELQNACDNPNVNLLNCCLEDSDEDDCGEFHKIVVFQQDDSITYYFFCVKSALHYLLIF